MKQLRHFSGRGGLWVSIAALLATGCGGGGSSSTSTSTPAPAMALAMQTIASGDSHSLRVQPDGTVWEWWQEDNPRAAPLNHGLPTVAVGLSGVVAVSRGSGGTSWALRSDGTVWTWGMDNIDNTANEQCQNSVWGWLPSPCRKVPTQVPNVTSVRAMAMTSNRALVVKSDGTVWRWGFGFGADVSKALAPVQVGGLANIQDVAFDQDYALALRNDGTVWGWGTNYAGQLGTTASDTSTRQQVVQGLTQVTAIATADTLSMALTADGHVWEWGGGLGFRPILVDIDGVAAIASGGNHAVALKSDGTVWSWGWDTIGDGSAPYANIPTRIRPTQALGLTNVVAIAAGTTTTVAVKSDGSVWTWGRVNALSVDTQSTKYLGVCPTSNSTKNLPAPNNAMCAGQPVKVRLPGT